MSLPASICPLGKGLREELEAGTHGSHLHRLCALCWQPLFQGKTGKSCRERDLGLHFQSGKILGYDLSPHPHGNFLLLLTQEQGMGSWISSGAGWICRSSWITGIQIPGSPRDHPIPEKKMREKWGFKGFIPSFPGDIQVQWESSDRNGSSSRFSRESKASLDGIWSNLVGVGMGSALSLSQPNHSKDLMKCGKTKRGRFEGSLEGSAGVFQEIHFYGNFGYWE